MPMPTDPIKREEARRRMSEAAKQRAQRPGEKERLAQISQKGIENSTCKLPVPPKEDLERLYIEQHLPSYKIGLVYGVSDLTVLRWLHDYEIPVRLRGRGFVAQGKEKPTPEELRKLIYDDGLSYNKIAAKYGTDRSVIGNWVKAYGIPQPGQNFSTRKSLLDTGITIEAFLEMYEGQNMSIYMIAQHYGTTNDKIILFVKQNGVTLRAGGFNGGKRFPCEDGHIVRSVYEQRVDNWLYQHGFNHLYEPTLPFDKRYRADFLVNGWYIEIWGMRSSPEHAASKTISSYVQRHLYKVQQYKKHQLPLIEIYDYHFDLRRNDPWARKLAKHLLPPQ